MKRIRYSSLACSAIATIALAGVAFATPAPNSAFIAERTFNNCPLSTLTTTNAYPASISITDVMDPACVGFANLHSWSFSEDGGGTASLFKNGSNFHYCADVTISGQGEGEGGLRVSPWWAKFVDGRFMLNVTSGEIACFGGRLPFYSFTVGHGITYTRGTTVHMEITYLANGLSAADPATIEYTLVMGGTTYSSGPLAFDEGNVGEGVIYGNWGMLHDGVVGGYFQPRANTAADLTCTWSEICFDNLDVVPTQSSTWGRIKTLYR